MPRQLRTTRARKRHGDIQSSPQDTVSPPANSPSARRTMPVCVRPVFRPPYVDYNPNMPPATFPTLDTVLPSGSANTSGPGTAEIHSNDGQEDSDVVAEELQEQTENRDPMEIDATSEKTATETEIDENIAAMESSDDEAQAPYADGYEEPEFKFPRKIRWKDLHRTLRLEIIENISKIYGFEDASFLLDLNQQDKRDTLIELEAGNRQIDAETEQLKEMQQKQLRALLRIDNSVLKTMRVPAQLVFRNVSKKYLKEASSRPGSDFLVIKVSDLLIAREYLRRKHLCPDYVGEWTNGLAAIVLDPEGNGKEKLDWKFNTSEKPENGIEQDTIGKLGMKSACQPPSPPLSPKTKERYLNSKIRFINYFGGAISEKPTRRNVAPDELNVARQILRRHKAHTRRQHGYSPRHSKAPRSVPSVDGSGGIVRLKVGPEGAAKIHSDSVAPVVRGPTRSISPHAPAVSSPLRNVQTIESLSSEQSQLNDGGAGFFNRPLSSPSSRDNRSNLRREYKLPARRILAGSWWYNSCGHAQRRYSPYTSGNLQSRFLAARAQTETGRVTGAATGEEDSAPSGLSSQSITESTGDSGLSSSTTANVHAQLPSTTAGSTRELKLGAPASSGAHSLPLSTAMGLTGALGGFGTSATSTSDPVLDAYINSFELPKTTVTKQDKGQTGSYSNLPIASETLTVIEMQTTEEQGGLDYSPINLPPLSDTFLDGIELVSPDDSPGDCLRIENATGPEVKSAVEVLASPTKPVKVDFEEKQQQVSQPHNRSGPVSIEEVSHPGLAQEKPAPGGSQPTTTVERYAPTQKIKGTGKRGRPRKNAAQDPLPKIKDSGNIAVEIPSVQELSNTEPKPKKRKIAQKGTPASKTRARSLRPKSAANGPGKTN
ncbi:hypothetical protein VTO42DRAFT_2942 [Malbranchea cinnamomea]